MMEASKDNKEFLEKCKSIFRTHKNKRNITQFYYMEDTTPWKTYYQRSRRRRRGIGGGRRRRGMGIRIGGRRERGGERKVKY